MKALSHNGMPIQALEALSSLYMCYETDLCLYIKTISKSSNTYSKVIKALEKRNYIVKSKLFNKRVVAITKKGIIALCDLFPNRDFFALTNKAKDNFPSLTDSTKLFPRLEENTLALFFKSFTFNKPDLYYLYCNLEEQEEYEKDRFNPDQVSPLYKNSLEDFQGRFYTKKEVLKLNELLKPNDPMANDLYYSSRFRGVYLSYKHIFVVYHTSSYSSGVLKINLAVEESICRLITDLFSYPLSVYDRAECLLVGRSPSYAYNLLIGKFGHHQELDNGPRFIHAKKNQSFLDLSSGIYRRYYVISNTFYAQEELNYLLTHSVEEYSADVKEYFDSCEGFSCTKEGNYYDEDTGGYAFYLPYIELSLLDAIYKGFNNPTIVTQPYLAEAVAHCLRKPCNIYDFDLNLLQTSTYTKSGYKEGEIVPIKKRKPRTKRNGITLTNIDFYDDIKKLAKLKNTSMSSLAKKILSPLVKEELVKEEQKLEKIKNPKANRYEQYKEKENDKAFW